MKGIYLNQNAQKWENSRKKIRKMGFSEFTNSHVMHNKIVTNSKTNISYLGNGSS